MGSWFVVVLLHAQIELAAFRDAESTAVALAPLIGRVGAGRRLARLSATLRAHWFGADLGWNAMVGADVAR